MLTNPLVLSIKPALKPLKLYDEKGLFLLVQTCGSKLWRFKYRFPARGKNRKEKLLSLGSFPEVSLKDARNGRDDAREDLRNGIDPSTRRKAEEHSPSNTFEAIARELLDLLRKGCKEGQPVSETVAEVVQRTIAPHRQRKRRERQREPISAHTIETIERRLEMHVFPHIGGHDIALVKGPDVLSVLRRIESRGTYDLAHRVRSICSRVFRYARATGRECADVAADLIGLLVPVEAENMPTITEPARVGQLLRSGEGYHGEPVTRLALRLVPRIFPRPGEFRRMEWAHITLDGPRPQWRVPWQRMKMRMPHIVPLSRQAVAILREIHRHTGHGRWVFPQLRHPDRPMSENCITAALRAMGYTGEEMTWHGFRGLASTLLNELGWNDKWIEMQLAHTERNKVKKAYNHAKYLPQREAMMQFWSDYIDILRDNTDMAIANTLARKVMVAAMSNIHHFTDEDSETIQMPPMQASNHAAAVGSSQIL